MLAQDLQRMELIPGNLYSFHPGAHTGQGIETGITQIANALNQLLKPEMNTTVLLETMAGKGSEVGGTFEERQRSLLVLNAERNLAFASIPATLGMPVTILWATSTGC